MPLNPSSFIGRFSTYPKMIGRFSTYSRCALCLVLLERSLADPTFPCWLCMVLVHEYSLPGRILARRAVTMAAGGVEQQPPVGETPLLARSPALSSISLAFLGAWSGHPKPPRLPSDHPEGRWDIRDENPVVVMLRGRPLSITSPSSRSTSRTCLQSRARR